MDLVAKERLEGRRVLVYVTHTGTRDITGRMDDILTRYGFRVAVMKANAVAPDRREAWVADRVKEGIDVIICHPRLVQTGLDLIDFPTIVWGEVDYSVYVMRQASRRSWRIGQTRPGKGNVHVLQEHPSRPTPSSWWRRSFKAPWPWRESCLRTASPPTATTGTT